MIDKDVNEDVKTALKKFTQWLRSEYEFPMRIPVYVKSSEYITAADGEHVVGIFFEPDSYDVESYIKIAAGDYATMLQKRGRDNALASILRSLSHELTHYYQWINDLPLTDIGRERQATMYANYIMNEYAEIYEHP
ncbi:MAG: hypothetical protein PUB43_00540 [Oscillospiraceae bacterium]|nr:hypothetical protein [Oscillospiraceae bacterium]